ncbi:MAG: MutS protein msh5, partial [Paramarteilia canceri]
DFNEQKARYYICESVEFFYHNSTNNENNEKSDEEKLIFASSFIDFTVTNQMKALSGLLCYLERNNIGTNLDMKYSIVIREIKNLELQNMMLFREEVFNSLQIFSSIAHPSAHKTSLDNKNKEGLSLYSILNRCRSRLGAQRLKSYLQCPLTDIGIIEKRLNSIQFYLNKYETELFQKSQNSLSKISKLETIMNKMKLSHPSVNEWLSFRNTIKHILSLKKLALKFFSENIEKNCSYCEHLKKLSDISSDELIYIESILNNIFDNEESRKYNRFIVRPGVDNILDKKKNLYNELPDLMTKVANEELEDLDDIVDECMVVYLPQLGYMVAISDPQIVNNFCKNSNETGSFEKTNITQNLNGMEFLFVSDGVAHFKSSRTKELDSLLGDTLCDIMDIENKIQRELQDKIVEKSSIIFEQTDICAEIDVMISIASVAFENSYTKPEFNKIGMMEILDGRHPIQELCTDPFIPNDCLIGSNTGKFVNLISGSNGSGKSIYIKQVALINYMAQCGFFVPAKSCSLPVIDSLHLRLGSYSLQSISNEMSSFVTDLGQVLEAIAYSSNVKSLILLDEFGKGTDSISGTALLNSVLKYWAQNSTDKIRSQSFVFAISHRSELFEELKLNN